MSTSMLLILAGAGLAALVLAALIRAVRARLVTLFFLGLAAAACFAIVRFSY